MKKLLLVLLVLLMVLSIVSAASPHRYYEVVMPGGLKLKPCSSLNGGFQSVGHINHNLNNPYSGFVSINPTRCLPN